MNRRRFLVAASALAALAGCSESDDGDPDAADDTDGQRISASGDIAVRIDGTAFDLSQERFQAEHADESLAFHLHDGDDLWYMEGAERVTVAEGIDLLPAFAYRRDGWRTVTVDGTTYDEADAGVETAFRVDDALVDPEAHELQDGEALLLEIATEGAASHDESSGSVDASGAIDIVVDGEPLDLSQERFQAEHGDGSLAFHLHAGDDLWYMEGSDRVTVAEGLELLPSISSDRSGGYHRLTVADSTYDERDAGTELAVYVDGDLVDPTAWELADGEEIRVDVATG